MPIRTRSHCLALALFGVASSIGLTAPAVAQDAALQQRINAAIDGGVGYLKTQQHRDGSWTGAMIGSYRAGPTAFTAYALVESGVSPDDPCIQLALSYLYANRPTMTYSAGALLLLLAEIGGDEHEDLAEETLDQLLDWENDGLRGSWAYPSGQVDLSNTQFAALGFWAAHRLGLDVPVDVCKRMVLTTIDAHQDDPAPATKEDPAEKQRTRAGKRKMAGFTYLPDRTKPARGSMTVAGICVQRFAREIHGRKLGNKVAQASAASERLAMNWLFEYWDPSTNPGMDDGGQVLYYLWGVERLGALLERERLFGVDWYVDGAKVILGKQEDSGSWGRYHQTVYALLFLTRATRREAFSGPKRSARAADAPRAMERGPIRFTVTGSMELTMWITGIDDAQRIERVEWFAGDEVIQTLEGDAAKRWAGERYAARWSPGRAGRHNLAVGFTIVASDPDTGTERRTTRDSRDLQVETSWSPDVWMRAALDARGENLIAGTNVQVVASSEAPGHTRSAPWTGSREPPGCRRSRTASRRSTSRSCDRFVATSVVLSHAASRTSTSRSSPA